MPRALPLPGLQLLSMFLHTARVKLHADVRTDDVCFLIRGKECGRTVAAAAGHSLLLVLTNIL